MSATPIVAPFPVFNDVDGQPLDAGYIYVGTENLEPVTNPISIYWDEALTIPAVQPVRTINGYPSRAGTPAAFFAATNYSILVRDRNGSLVFSAPTSATASALLLADVLRSDLASADPSKGDALIGMKVIATGAVASTVHLYNEARPLYAKLDFGAIGDGIADDYAELQAAIDAAIVTGRKLIIEQGTYKTSAPLLIAKWSGTAFSYLVATIEGAITPWDFATSTPASGQATVVIKPTFKDTFAIGIQNGRAVSLKNIFVLGQNTFNIGSGLTAPNYPEMMTNATFVNNGVRDSRYSPYAGICIDPFKANAPADGGYPGLSAYYGAANNAAGSSGLRFENVCSENFTVGIAITPNGGTANAENIEFLNCATRFNKVGLSIGQSQSRNVNWRGGDNAFNLYCFDGSTYGQQQGYAPGIFGCNVAGKYLFNVPNGFGTQEIHKLHAESFASIGFLGTNSSVPSPVSFFGCDFIFSNFGGIFADWHLYADGPTAFHSCEFAAPGLSNISPLRIRNSQAGNTTFYDCGFQLYGASSLEFFLAPSTGTNSLNQNGLLFFNCVNQNDVGHGPSSGKNTISNIRKIYAPSSGNHEVCLPGTEYQFASLSNHTVRQFTSANDNVVSLGSISVTTGANGTASFTATDGTIINTGDTIYNGGASSYENGAGGTTSTNWNALGIVTSVVGNVVTISGWPQSLVSGTFTLFSAWWPRYHQASVGDTSTSVNVANVTNPAAWKNGQHIRGSGIVNGTYIVSGGGTASLVLSKATTSTLVGTRLYDADVYSLTGTAV